MSLLDDPKGMRALDGSGILDALAAFAKQLEPGLRAADGVAPAAQGVDRVLVAGMGGSATGGDLLAGWVNDRCPVSVEVSRDYRLPGWVGERTLVLVVSYSGSTSETRSQLAAALEAGAQIVAVTSGGAIGETCTERGVPVVCVPAGCPRGPGQVGHLIGGIVAACRAIGLPFPFEEFDAGHRDLVRLNEAWHPDVPVAKNLAKQIAIHCQDRIPVIYGSGPMGRIAARWAFQLSENAKTLAFWGEMPEANHNEIVGWEEDERTAPYTHVLLHSGEEHAEMARRMQLTQELLERASGAAVVVQPPETTRFARMMHALFLGDCVSVYNAFARGFDPVPTPAIDRFKAALAERRA